jgi:hypothetical protein
MLRRRSQRHILRFDGFDTNHKGRTDKGGGGTALIIDKTRNSLEIQDLPKDV